MVAPHGCFGPRLAQLQNQLVCLGGRFPFPIILLFFRGRQRFRHLADDQQGRSGQPVFQRQLLQRGAVNLLPGLRSVRHNHARRRSVQPAIHQLRGYLAVVFPRHVHGIRRVFQRHVMPFRRHISRHVVTQENDLGGVSPVRQRNFRCRRRTHRRRHSGNHFKFDSSARQRFHFFAHAPKQQRVTALQPHHLLALARRSDQQGMNLVLRDSRLPAPLSHIAHLRPRGN